MNRHEFQAHEGNMARLAEVLRDPVVAAAFDILRAEGAISILPEPQPGVDYSALVAAAGAYAMGWSRAIKSLESLTRLPQRAAAPIIFNQPQFAEAAKERMKQSGLYSEEEVDKL